MTSYKWTNNSVELLKANHDNMTRAELAELLGTDQKTVSRKCSEIGLVQGRGCGKQRFWSEEKCQYLRDNYNGSNAVELAAALGIDKHTKLYSILSKLGLSKTRKYTDIGLGESDTLQVVDTVEIWKAIPSDVYPDESVIFQNYEFSTEGRVRNIKFDRILNITAPCGKNSYKRLEVKGVNYTLHILIAKAHVLNEYPLSQIFVNHIDGNKLNCRPDNLEWVTPAANARHSVLLKESGKIPSKAEYTDTDELNTIITNQKAPSRYLTDSEIHVICHLIKTKRPYKDIIAQSGISGSWSNRFCNFKNCTYRPDITELYFK
jgi:hypothetical protein